MREICHLIELYRTIFGGNYSSANKVENVELVASMLDAFSNQFKAEQAQALAASAVQTSQTKGQSSSLKKRVKSPIMETNNEESESDGISQEVSKKLEIVEN